MKTYIHLIITFALLTGTCVYVNAQSGSKHKLQIDTNSRLVIKGKVFFDHQHPAGPVKVELLKHGQVEDSMTLSRNHKHFYLSLKRDSYYTIRVSKPGYASKLICVNTQSNSEINGLYLFQFEVALITETEAKKLDQDAIDFPVALIYFDPDDQAFNYNKKYTASLKKQLYTPLATR